MRPSRTSLFAGVPTRSGGGGIRTLVTPLRRETVFEISATVLQTVGLGANSGQQPRTRGLGSATCPHSLGVVLGSLKLRAVGKENERQPARAERLGLQQRHQRIAVEVD